MREYGGMTKKQYEKFMDDYEKGYPELVNMLHRLVWELNEITGLDWSRVIDWERVGKSGK